LLICEVADFEEEPTRMTSCITIDSHQQIVFRFWNRNC